jgi:phenylpropionate dioxygenase-like ring-hydroxylating dioxygenase large terminal subunit
MSMSTALLATAFYVPLARVSALSTERALSLERSGIKVAILLNETRLPVAYLDVCPHRGSSLNGAAVRNNTVVCPYHGYTYDLQSSKLASGLGVTAGCGALTRFPCIISEDLVWGCLDGLQWPPPPPPALENLLPTFRRITGSVRILCPVQSLVENVLDCVHTSFVHSFGNSMDPEPMEYTAHRTGPRSGLATFHYKAGPTSLFSGNVKVLNWFHAPVTAGTSVTSGQNCKIVQVHAVQEGGGYTRVYWELTRNFGTSPFLDWFFRIAMDITLDEDRLILEHCTPVSGAFHSRYDRLQMLYRHTMRRLTSSLTPVVDHEVGPEPSQDV